MSPLIHHCPLLCTMAFFHQLWATTTVTLHPGYTFHLLYSLSSYKTYLHMWFTITAPIPIHGTSVSYTSALTYLFAHIHHICFPLHNFISVAICSMFSPTMSYLYWTICSFIITFDILQRYYLVDAPYWNNFHCNLWLVISYLTKCLYS